MPSSSDFIVKFKADQRALKKAISDLKKLEKSQIKHYQSLAKEEQKLRKAAEKEEDRLWKRKKKRQKDHLAEIKKQNKEEARHSKRQESEEKKRSSKKKSDRRAEESWFRRMGNRVSAFERKHFPTFGGAARRAPGRVFRTGMGGIGGIIGLMVGASVSGYQRYMELGAAKGASVGLGPGGSGRTVARALSRAYGQGARLGFSKIDVAGQMPLMARATGALGPQELMHAQRMAALKPDEAAQIFGQIRQAGFDFEGGQAKGAQSRGATVFAKVIEGGIVSGLERGRLPEYLAGMHKMMSQQGAILAGRLDPVGLAGIAGAMGQTGLAGFQGARGMGVMDKLQQAFLKPGGGEWGQVFMRQAQGFGVPGGTTSYYTAEKSREQGLTPDNLRRVMGTLAAQMGENTQQANLAMREVFGISLSQAEGMWDIYRRTGGSMVGAEVEQAIKDAEPIEKQSLEQLKAIAGGIKRIATVTNRSIKRGEEFKDEIEDVEDKLHKAFMYLAENIKTLSGKIQELINKLPSPKREDNPKTKKMEKMKSEMSMSEMRVQLAKEGMHPGEGIFPSWMPWIGEEEGPSPEEQKKFQRTKELFLAYFEERLYPGEKTTQKQRNRVWKMAIEEVNKRWKPGILSYDPFNPLESVPSGDVIKFDEALQSMRKTARKSREALGGPMHGPALPPAATAPETDAGQTPTAGGGDAGGTVERTHRVEPVSDDARANRPSPSGRSTIVQ